MSASSSVNLERLRLADFNLSQCGVPQLPEGARYVDIIKTLVYNSSLGQAGSGSDILPDERQGTHSDTIFILRAIQITSSTTVNPIYVRFQWPNGRYLQNVPVEINVAYPSTGQFRKVLRSGVLIRPGEQIRISLQNFAAASGTVPIVILFEGFLRFYLKGRNSAPCCIADL